MVCQSLYFANCLYLIMTGKWVGPFAFDQSVTLYMASAAPIILPRQKNPDSGTNYLEKGF